MQIGAKNVHSVFGQIQEVAEDHVHYIDHPRWLIAVDMPQMTEVEYAGPMIWEMLWEGHEGLISELAEHYRWEDILTKAREAKEQ